MRYFIASLATETNTFAPFPAGMAAYDELGIRREGRESQGPLAGPLRVWRACAEAQVSEIFESIAAFAQPSGKTVRSVYEHLRDLIVEDLRKAGPVDVILLMLHGAMVAEGYDDCEGDLLRFVRQVAPDAVIGVELDPHCHLTHDMVNLSDIIIIGKEYPHIDFEERAEELFDLCRRMSLGEIHPTAALIDVRMIGFYPTFNSPMKEIVAALREAEGKDGILSASLAHGFPWADVADVGTRVLVYSDRDAKIAEVHAYALARLLYDARQALVQTYPGITESLNRASTLKGIVVLGDFADNPGGGAPGDSTFFLREILARDLDQAVVGCLWDPLVAQLCADAGIGAWIKVRLGGKCGVSSGEPLDLEVKVVNVVENHSERAFGSRQSLGLSVWLRAEQVDIVVSSIRTQVFAPDAFTGLGIRLDDKRLIVVKSSNHYHAEFIKVANHLWNVCSPGTMDIDFASIPYTMRDPEYFPNMSDPWNVSGVPQVTLFSKKLRMKAQ